MLLAIVALVVGFGAGPVAAPPSLPLRGVNLSGAELNGDKLPGRLNFDYVYPTAGELRHFSEAGMTVIRLPVLWERLQPRLDGPLDDEEVGHLRAVILAAEPLRLKLIIDLHNFGSYRGQRVGSPAVPSRSFGAFWRGMAMVFSRNRNVVFGLMNEPNGIDAMVWLSAAQLALHAIRDAGATNLVLVPGTGWDGAHNFVSGAGYGMPNAAALGRLEDAGYDSAIEVHQYLDEYSTGARPECPAAEHVASLLEPFTAWLRANGRRGFLGEFGVSREQRCLDGLAAMLRYMADNGDVWLGWSYWAGGPWWSRDYMFSVEPVDRTDRPQMKVLQAFLPMRVGTGRQP